MSDSLWRHGLQHARLPCPSSTPGAYSNLCPLNQWCYPIISSSVISFSSCLQCFSASESFPMSQFFKSDSQIIEVSVSASVLPINIQGWFPLGLNGLISLLLQGMLKSLLQNYNSKALILWCSALSMVQLSHLYMTTRKTIALIIWTFVWKWCLWFLICCPGLS